MSSFLLSQRVWRRGYHLLKRTPMAHSLHRTYTGCLLSSAPPKRLDQNAPQTREQHFRTMVKWGSNKQQSFGTLIVILVVVLVTDVNAVEPIDCRFLNTSMVPPTACSHNDSRSMSFRMLACLPYLDEDEVAPSAKCCAGVRNVSAVSPPCLCRHIFSYRGPAAAVNQTRGKLMPGLCNVTSDLCRVCSAFVVDGSQWGRHHSSMVDSEDRVSSYRKKVLALAVVLGFAMACIIVATVLFIRKKLKQRRALPAVVVKSDFQSKQPGSDY